MPATPAWPPESLPRLFVDQPLGDGERIELEGPPAHYLVNVLRLRPPAQVALFDDRSGEWLGTLTGAAKRTVSLAVGPRLRPRETVPDLWLLFAPIKRGRIDWLVEKATELGVARLVPVITARTVVARINLERLRSHAVEAAEQCGRTALPVLEEPVALAGALADWPSGRALHFADESGGDPILAVAAPGPAAILIGPEGGFDEAERGRIRALPEARAVSLGPRILRADTAAMAAMALWMAAAGDWSQ